MVAGQPMLPGLAAIGHGSHASPLPSPSVSACPGLGTVGQLSDALGTPSPSMSLGSKDVQVVVLASRGQGSHASPTPSPSTSGCAPLSIGRIGLNTVGQLSIASGMPSPSLSVAEVVPVNTVEPATACGRVGVHV